MTAIDRRSYLTALATVPIIGVAAGCLGESDGQGILATHVSDQPGDIMDFETLLIQISEIRVKPENEELVRIDADSEIDLTELIGEASELIDETELEAGTYEFLQLEAEATDATLNEGSSVTVEVPGDAPLKFNEQFDIESDQTTTFIADFTPVKQGQTGRYVLQPVASEVEVIYQTETAT